MVLLLTRRMMERQDRLRVVFPSPILFSTMLKALWIPQLLTSTSNAGPGLVHHGLGLV